MSTAIVTGGSGSLGRLIIKALQPHFDRCINWSLWTGVDVSSAKSVAKAAGKVTGTVDVLINCAGLAHLAWIPDLQEEDFDTVMGSNAKGILLTTQALLSQLKGGTILNITSEAARKPMRCSLAYNASKAAAEMMTRQMARELQQTHDITVFSISPGKLRDTQMSRYIDETVPVLRGWTTEFAKDYQRSSLVTGEEADPEALAEFVGFILSTKDRHRWFAGQSIPYGG